MGRLCPYVQPLALLQYIPFWQKRYPFYIPFIEGSEVPLTPTYFRTLHPLSEPLCNITGEYLALFIYSVHVVKQPISLPIIYLNL